MLAALISLIVTLAFLKVWSPAPDTAYAVDRSAPAPAPAPGAAVASPRGAVPAWQAGLPWIIVSVVVIAGHI